MVSDSVLEVRGARARALLRQAIQYDFPGRIAAVSSFGADSAVLLHLVASVAPDLPVLFLDTGKHFAATQAYRRDLAARLGLGDLRAIRPDAGALAAADPDGLLHRRDPERCCSLRKIRPLQQALSAFDAWISGRKRFQTADRHQMPVIEPDGPRTKLNPLAEWSPQDIAAYSRRHDLPPHPLVARGFASIGCVPCTSPVAPGEAPRAGRWRGQSKSECGIHLPTLSANTEDSTMRLFTSAGFVDDRYRRIDDLEALPTDGRPILVSLARWQAERRRLIDREACCQIGVALAPDDPVSAIGDDLGVIDLIELRFDSFTDGRGYSQARALRERYRFRGEVRASGEVLWDQLAFLRRCGVSSFAIRDPATLATLERGRRDAVALSYQPAPGGLATILAERAARPGW